jgi:hypothetical protein
VAGRRRARLAATGLRNRRPARTDYDLQVAGPLVRHVRSGAARELRDAVADMQEELDTTIDPARWKSTLGAFDEARALLDFLGVEDDPKQGAIVLDLGRWPRLILRLLEDEYDSEVRRLRDAQHEGHDLPSNHISELERLANEVRRRTGARKRRRRSGSFLEAQVEKRRNRGRRGNLAK